ncbi:hypothetical protein [Actinomadura rifamycini]|uniref:hypothetical protein n=1 Tax=Actinomadura rifamycini TaxID=31962 RepID=UPI00041BC38E|nr:hypothetical protein [Actinomadura rifamycini]
MAVTLLLARVAPAVLGECGRSVAALDRLCSFEAMAASEYLDLDWAGGGIVHVCEVLGAGAVRGLLDGGEEVNLAYRDRPDGVVEPPRAVAAEDVARCAAQLEGIGPEGLPAALPSDPDAAGTLLGEPYASMEGHPLDYMAAHFTALRRFCRVAAERRLAVVTWWD